MNKLFMRKTLRDFRASWAQSVALMFIVALGIAAYVALVGSYRDLKSSYDRTYETLHFADATFAVAEAPLAVADELRALAGVTAVTPRLIRDTGYELPDGEPIRARLIGLPQTTQPDVNQLVIAEGQFFSDGATPTSLVEAHFADIYGIQPGDAVTPIINGDSVPLRVAGIGISPEYLIVSPSQQDMFPSARTFAVLWLPLTTVQILTGSNADVVNEFTVLLDETADTDTVVRQIQEILQPYELETTILQTDQPSNALLQQDVAGYKELANMMPAIILLVAAISVYVLLGRMVRAQQPQVGLMKALGYGTSDVLRHYLLFALVIGLVGLVLGVCGGIPLARWVTSTYAQELSIPFVQTQFYPDLVMQSVLISLALCLLAGYGPARSAARLAPAEAMRIDPAVALVNGRQNFLERMLPLPLEMRLPLRNVLRMRRRSLTTGLGIVFAFILVLMVWAMLDSMSIFMDQNFEKVERWDVTAVFDKPQNNATLELVRSWDGVIAAEPIIQLPVTLLTGDEREDVLLTAVQPDQQMHALQLPEGDTATAVLGDNQIVLSQALAEELGLHAGDEITVDTPFGKQAFTVSSTTKELVSTAVYVSIDDALALSPFPMAIFNGLYLQVEPSDVSRIKADLYHLPGTASVARKTDLYNDLLEMLNLFYTFMGVMFLFALGMAFALLFNATTVNVLERQRELATMRSIGTSNWQIAAQITAENVVLWLLCLVPGLLLGYAVALQLGDAFSSELFSLDITIAPTSYVITSLGILLTMLLAAWPAIRRVNRLNLAEATKVLV
ncbi:MAG: FtsX-like permease family protein [Chloroflexota bacterium]